MAKEIESVNCKGNGTLEFTVYFWSDRISIDGRVLPVGQISTDVLNLSDDQILALRQKIDEIMKVLSPNGFDMETKKDPVPVAIPVLQEKLKDVVDSVMSLPPYKHLDMAGKLASDMLSAVYGESPELFNRTLLPGTIENGVLVSFMKNLVDIPEELHAFRVNILTMLDYYFERIKRRNAEHYAFAVNDFLSDREVQEKITALLPDAQRYPFLQDRTVLTGYTTMPDPEKPQKYIIAERMVLDSIASFLHADFFRGLMNGNVPRRCHNCGLFFLLLKGYNICYCLNIAPGYDSRTCREVGAHKKEARREGKTAARREYEKVYNRLKVRRARGKISTDEWKAAVAKALVYKDKTEAGEISDYELKDIYDKM